MNLSHKWDPKKPAAPVIKILGTAKFLNEKMFELKLYGSVYIVHTEKHTLTST